MKFPALKFGLEQIPKKYLKENLLPQLKDPHNSLLFDGNIYSPDRSLY